MYISFISQDKASPTVGTLCVWVVVVAVQPDVEVLLSRLGGVVKVVGAYSAGAKLLQHKARVQEAPAANVVGERRVGVWAKRRAKLIIRSKAKFCYSSPFACSINVSSDSSFRQRMAKSIGDIRGGNSFIPRSVDQITQLRIFFSQIRDEKNFSPCNSCPIFSVAMEPKTNRSSA